MALLNHLQEVLLREAHGDVLDHHSGQVLDAVEYGVEVDGVVSQLGDLVGRLRVALILLHRGRGIHAMPFT